MRPPTVSVGLPVYNGEKYLPNALTRLLEQEFEDFELIVSDNASTDATEAICREFVARDRRVRYHRNAVNVGLAANHNQVFSLARGQFFKWSAYDDDFPRPMLARFVSALQQRSVRRHPRVFAVRIHRRVRPGHGRRLRRRQERPVGPQATLASACGT